MKKSSSARLKSNITHSRSEHSTVKTKYFFIVFLSKNYFELRKIFFFPI